jgi:hypothetical protein
MSVTLRGSTLSRGYNHRATDRLTAEFILVVDSTVILASESHATRYQIVLSDGSESIQITAFERERREEKVVKDITFGDGARNHIFGWLLNVLWPYFNT